jgi:hypothetical protein
MTEWYDSQRKPNSNFHKLLQERMDKANPRRKLTSDETKRLTKLESIAAKLKRGENVQNCQLLTWLSDDEYAQIEAEWKEQLELREELKDKPSELKRYEEKLQEATFHYNRAEGYSSRGYVFRGIIDSLICRGKINDVGWKSLFFGMTKGMMCGEITS